MFEFNIQTANVHNIPIVLTVQDMSEILRVADIVIEELVRDGKIRAIKDLPEIRVPSISFLNFLSKKAIIHFKRIMILKEFILSLQCLFKKSLTRL